MGIHRTENSRGPTATHIRDLRGDIVRNISLLLEAHYHRKSNMIITKSARAIHLVAIPEDGLRCGFWTHV